MKRFISYLTLCLCIIFSINIQAKGQGKKKVILEFKDSYSKKISLKDFVKELNLNPHKYNFKDSLTKELTNSWGLTKQKEVALISGDEKIWLYFSFSNKNDNNKVSKISIESLTNFFKNDSNKVFRDSLKLRLSSSPEQTIDTINVIKIYSSTEKNKKNIIEELGLVDLSPREKQFLSYWEYSALVLLVILIFFWWLGWFIGKRTILNKIIFSSTEEKNTVKEIIDFWKKNIGKINKENENTRNRIPYMNTNSQIESKETEEAKALEICNKIVSQKDDEIKRLQALLGKQDVVDNTDTSDLDSLNIDKTHTITYRSEIKTFYFSSCYKEGSFGIFEDENKSLVRQPDSLYRLDVSTEKPNEATFYFDPTSSDTKALLGYVAYTIEPVCNSTNPFQNNYTRITHISNGKAFLENGKWIVSGENKATIRYE